MLLVVLVMYQVLGTIVLSDQILDWRVYLGHIEVFGVWLVVLVYLLFFVSGGMRCGEHILNGSDFLCSVCEVAWEGGILFLSHEIKWTLFIVRYLWWVFDFLVHDTWSGVFIR